MTTRKDVAVSFLLHAASGRVREAYDKQLSQSFRLWDIGQAVPAESVNANGMF